MLGFLVASVFILWILTVINTLLVVLLLRRRSQTNSQSGIPKREGVFLDVGAKAPVLKGFSLNDDIFEIESFTHPTALFFVMEGCQPCENAFPRILPIAREIQTRGCSPILVFEGSTERARNYLAKRDVHMNVVCAFGTDLIENFKANSFPSFCLVNPGGDVFLQDHIVPDAKFEVEVRHWLKKQKSHTESDTSTSNTVALS